MRSSLDTGQPVPFQGISGQGLSPRVRGSRRQPLDRRSPDGVYPREYGAAYPSPEGPPHAQPIQGLSPRVRGSRPMPPRDGAAVCKSKDPWHGSIPASTGQPGIVHHCHRRSVDQPRSIPASTGQPHAGIALDGVYSHGQVDANFLGLSPRVRGSPFRAHVSGRSLIRSIPASTGQPSSFWRVPGKTSVLGSIPASTGQPDVCNNGGNRAQMCGRSIPASTGQPQSHDQRRGSHGSGSIPASTGQPEESERMRTSSRKKVYPREYGAA